MKRSIASYIDATVLKPTANRNDILTLCQQAQEYDFACVCVSGLWADLCVQQLQGYKTRVCSVVGFPFGNQSSICKAHEARELVLQGVTEIDMVISLGSYFSQNHEYVLQDIQIVREAIYKASDEVKNKHTLLKVILETCYLSDEDIIRLCKLSINGGAEFVKTSTGFAHGGATEKHVKLMKNTIGENAYVKAAGSIRDYNTACAMLQVGADRIGTSSGVDIVQMRNAQKEENGTY